MIKFITREEFNITIRKLEELKHKNIPRQLIMDSILSSGTNSYRELIFDMTKQIKPTKEKN